MAPRHFGHIPGIAVGTAFKDRDAVAAAGVHRPPVAGISGTAKEGADSIVLNGGYEDDQDLGSLVIYTGQGGNDPNTGKQIADQELTRGNAALVTSQLAVLPVRVVRGAKGDPDQSPPSGYRYDGLYQVVSHWSEIGKSGFRVWRFRLEEIDGSIFTHAGLIPPAGNKTPGRKSGTADRTDRDPKVADFVKTVHKSRCQVCGETQRVPAGSIEQGAHIRPLGRPHFGPDTTDNVLCLCPNHHALLDNGGIYIDAQMNVRDMDGAVIGPLRTDPKHAIDTDHLEYHRHLWGYPD